MSDPLFAEASGYTLVAFGGYMAGVFLLGALAHRFLKKGAFLKEYFLGDRGLGAWVLGLTYVATSVSAGSFVGFPSLIYRHGWVMALWIGGYMVGGLVSKGVLAKRLNQVSRLSGAITVPDVLRDRFQSPVLGVLSSLFLLLFLIFNLVGQFKAGGLIMTEACGGVRQSVAYRGARDGTAAAIEGAGLWRAETAEDPGQFYDRDYPDYVLGLLVFAVTVVAYTAYGGFWAVTWTDVLQGIVIVLGALLLMVLALWKVGGLTAATTKLHDLSPSLVTGPGPDQFLPVGLAVSYFFLWTLGSMGQPVGMVRLMACRDTPTLRRSLFMIGLYYAAIYLPLIVTFVCARALYPTDYLGQTDKTMPAVALRLTEDWPLLGGLILAAPYAAAMSAVAGFLLLMSSSLVRDLYQRNINPNVSERGVKWVSYGTTAVVGVLVTTLSLRPPHYLQYLILFTGAGMACTFLAPTVLGLYWRRATRAGALAGLVGGFGTVTVLYILGWLGVGKPSAAEKIANGLNILAADSPLSAATLTAAVSRASKGGPAMADFAPVYLLTLDPVLWGLAVSFVLAIVVSWFTAPPPDKHVDHYFLADETSV